MIINAEQDLIENFVARYIALWDLIKEFALRFISVRIFICFVSHFLHNAIL